MYIMVLGSTVGIAQEPFFKKKYLYTDSVFTTLESIVNKGDDIFILGSTRVINDTLNKQGFLLLKLDTLGNILSTSLYADADKTTYIEREAQMQITSDGNLVFGFSFPNDDHLAIYDRELNLLDTINVATDFYEYSLGVRDVVVVEDGFIISGNYGYYKEFRPSFFIMKIGLDGKRQWYKSFSKWKRSIAGLVRKFDQSIIAHINQWHKLNDTTGVYERTLYDVTKEGDFSIIGHDSMVHVKEGYSSLHDIYKLSADRYIVINHAYKYFEEDEDEYFAMGRPAIHIMDTTFTFLKTYEYGEFSASNVFPSGVEEIDPMPDGNYVVSGHYLDEDGRRVYHIKLTPEGEILWTREDAIIDRPEEGKDVMHDQNATVVLPSGSIVSVGSYEIWLYPSVQTGYIIKMSKDGCIDPECTGRLLLKTDETTRLDAEITLYPNPTLDYFIIETDLDAYDLQIHNQYGRLLKTYHGIRDGKHISVDDLSSGMYYIRISKGKRFVIRKLVKL